MTTEISRWRLPGWQENGVEPRPQLIELTAKRWKGLMLIAFLLGLLGFLILGWQVWRGLYVPILENGFAHNTEPLTMLRQSMFGLLGFLSWLLIATSFGLGLYARFMAWWRHG